MTWEEIGEKARARLDASIPLEWRIPENKMPAADQKDVMDVPFLSGLFSEREILITTSSATHIVDVVAKGEWKAQEVARAFCKRAAVAHQLVCSPNEKNNRLRF
jgi:amidase